MYEKLKEKTEKFKEFLKKRAVSRLIRLFLLFLALKMLSDIAGEQEAIIVKWPVLSVILPLTMTILTFSLWTMAYLPIMIDAKNESKLEIEPHRTQFLHSLPNDE